MNCYLLGLLGLGLLGGSLLTLRVPKKQHQELSDIFSGELAEKHKQITLERRNHYLIGILIGLCLSFLVAMNVKLSNDFSRVMLFISITLGTAVMFYSLMPKSDYMLNYLKTPEENKKWLDVYKTMKFRYFMGLLLGILASIPLSMMLCKH